MSAPPQAPGRLERYRKLYFTSNSTERLILFSDAVFAIAMTLLVLEIKVPELSSEQVEAGELAQALQEEWTHLFGYALSFLFIGITWLTHHNIWKFIQRITGGLMWLNILQLMLVAFMPVPTALIAIYGPASRIAPISYALTGAAIGLLHVAVWSYARRHDLLDPVVEPDMYVMVRRHLMLTPAVFLVSCVIAIFAPLVAMLFWTSLWIVAFGSNRQMSGWLRRRDEQDALRSSSGAT